MPCSGRRSCTCLRLWQTLQFEVSNSLTNALCFHWSFNRAHILSLEHKEQLEGARLYAEVQISPSTKLGWIAQRVQAQCTIQLPDTDTNGVDRNAIVQVPHYSSPQNLEQSLVETTFKDELLGEDIRQLIESTDNSIWESLAGGSDVSH